MRRCIRCKIEMVEDCDIKIEGAAYGLARIQYKGKTRRNPLFSCFAKHFLFLRRVKHPA